MSPTNQRRLVKIQYWMTLNTGNVQFLKIRVIVASLYALSIVLHLVRGIRVTEHIFSQQVIMYFRKSLHVVLTAPKEELKANPKVIFAIRAMCSTT